MKSRNSKQVILPFLILMVVISGCAVSPAIEMTATLPPIVKEYQHVTLSPWKTDMVDTGIYLEKGDFFTILADASHKRKTLWFQIDHIFSPSEYYMPAPQAGKLHVGCPTLGSRKHRTGVDVIVWKQRDWSQIAEWLRMIRRQAPDNSDIEQALYLANRYEELNLAIAEASREIEKQKAAIRWMQNTGKQIPPTRPQAQNKAEHPPPDTRLSPQTGPQENFGMLEAKLGRLVETLAQLEEIEKKLKEEKEKSEKFAKELEKKEQREKELLSQLKNSKKKPPVIVIAYPSHQSEVEVSRVRLSGVIEDERGITGMEIFINGKPIEAPSSRGIRIEGDKDTKRLKLQEDIRLESGLNEIRLRVVDTDDLIAEKILSVTYVEKRQNIWAVVVGINEYTHVQKLKYAVNDARRFYEYLINRNQIPPENVTLLLDREASLKNLRSTLGTHLKKRAAKDDMVIIYFAGHGATEKDATSPDGDGLEKYLLPYSADPADLYATALPMEEVSKIFMRIRAERLVFIADACYSGASGGRTIGISGIRANISDAFLNRISAGKGRVIISASGANEVSVEDNELRQGVFTYHLIDGLKGKADYDRDGSITVDEVYRYVAEQVPAATGQEQHPVKKGTVEGRLILGITE